MDRYRIHLDTDSEIIQLNTFANSLDKNAKIYIQDSDGMCVNAKSLLGLFATRDFNNLYLVSDVKLPYNEIKDIIL